MSKIPKFRGWHKELEQMIYGKEICGYIEYNTNLINALNQMAKRFVVILSMKLI